MPPLSSRRFSLAVTKIMNVENRSKRHTKRQHDIIQVNLKNKVAPTLDRYKHRKNHLTLDIINNVAGQLGYHPFNIVDVVLDNTDADGSDDHPLVAVLYPLNHNEEVKGRYSGDDGPKPFPTTLWITCPDLHTRISKLEDLGFINKFQQKLLKDSNSATMLEQMHRAHAGYAQFRWDLLGSDDEALVISSGWTSALKAVGIAGIRNFDRVKCLHCHYAHHLARPEDGNLVGIWIHELLESNVDESSRNSINALIENIEPIPHIESKENSVSENDSNEIQERVDEDICDKMKNTKIIVEENLDEPVEKEIRIGSSSAYQVRTSEQSRIDESKRDVEAGMVSSTSGKLDNSDSSVEKIKISDACGTVPCLSSDKEGSKNLRSRSLRNIEESNKTVVKSPSWVCYKSSEGDSCVLN